MRKARVVHGASCAVAFYATAVAACSVLIDTTRLVGDGDAAATDASITETVSETSTSDVSADVLDATDTGSGDPSLVAEWLFDDGPTSTPRDSTGHGHDGQLVGSGTNVGPDTGFRGGALEVVDGESMYVESLRGRFPKAGTLMMYLHFDGQPATRPLAVFDDYAADREHFFVRRVSPDSRFQIAVQRSGQYDWLAEYNVPLSAWFHIAVTWTPDEAAFIYNGGVIEQKAITGGNFNAIAEVARFGGGMGGRIDEIRLFDRPLTPKEVDAYR